MRSARVLFAGAGSLAISLAVLFATPGPAGATRAATTRPVILSLKITHAKKILPARGVGVKVTVRVRNANRCIFYWQKKPRTPLRPYKNVSCRRGRAGVRIPRIPNPYPFKVRLTYAVKAMGANKTSTYRKVRLTEAAAPPKPTASLTLDPQTVPASGGTVTLTYSSQNATRCLLSASPDLWPGSNPLRVSCNGSTPVTVPASLSTQTWTVTFTAKNAVFKVTASQTLTQQGTSVSLSSNWSGYVVPSTSIITQVSGRFTVPTLDCSTTPNAGESTWVGIGGSAAGDTLLQTGVRSDCVGGVQVASAGWWEEIPPYPEIDFHSMSISAGDLIEASVYQQSDGYTWGTRLDDLTTGVSGLMVTNSAYGTVLDSAPSAWVTQEGNTYGLTYSGGRTAEWIVEAYGLSDGSQVPLADYGTITFTDLTTSLPSWSLTGNEAVALVEGENIVSMPSPPTSSTSFSVSYTG